ncbi:MAG TPA: hypothetical protein VLV89_03405, partial [Candidatus Acidoferrum sp.]|nr:hypothetical protein [Candidatus Acidoferrum sp.]
MNSRLLTIAQNRFLGALVLTVIAAIAVPPAVRAQASAAPSPATLTAQNSAAAQDPILQAMLAELNRSRDQLKMDNVAKPYYIEYRITDLDIYEADAAFGAMRYSQRARRRVVRAVVRIGDYKQDSYFGQGQGIAEQITVEDDVFALRHTLWLLTDEAYKRAGESLAAKQAMLKEVNP